MKKIAFVISAFFLLAVLTGPVAAQMDPGYEKALKYYNSGQFEDAVRLFKDYVKEKPEASAYYRIGYALYKLGRQDEATKYFNEAYLIDPDFSPALIGEQPLEGFMPERAAVPAVTAEEPVMPAPPAQLDPSYEKALKYYNSGQFEDAVRLFKDYVKEKPEASAYYRIGYALYKLGRQDEATKYFNEAYLINPDFTPVLPSVKQPVEHVKPEGPRVLGAAVEEPEAMAVIPVGPTVEKEEPVEEVKPAGIPPAPAVLPEEPAVEKEEIVPEEAPQPGITFEPPPGMPESPIPSGALAFLTGIMATLGIFSIVIEIALYIFFSLCFFKIGKKLDVSNSWLAWVPIVQGFWPLLGAAGKPWWWIFVLTGIAIFASLFPLLGPIGVFLFLIIIVVLTGYFVYLWMLMTENLGKNRWLGLLGIVPVAQLVLLGYLAFSESK